MKRLLICTTVFILGCAAQQGPPPAGAELHLKQLAIIYGRYLNANKGKSPKDEAEFKEFAKKLSPEELKNIGVADGNVDSIFTSPRDQQAYVVRYNENVPTSGPAGPPVIAHERTGQGGKKFVAFASTQVSELGDSEFTPIKPR